MFAVRQRYRGQSGVEQVFAFRVFSLLQASQQDFADASGVCAATNEERPLNMISTTSRSARLMVLEYAGCMVILYNDKEKMQSVFPGPGLVREHFCDFIRPFPNRLLFSSAGIHRTGVTLSSRPAGYKEDTGSPPPPFLERPRRGRPTGN